VKPIASEVPADIPPPPNEKVDPKMAARGFDLFHQNCAVCHGVLLGSSGEVPDLRAVPPEIWKEYDAIVLKGVLHDNGMSWFTDILTKKDVADIRAYTLQGAQALYASKHPEKIPLPKR
jgi:mono/diheme cytochrome c family protein